MPKHLTPAAFPLPDDFLRARAPGLYILTGPRGCGKTTWCQALADAARRRKLSIGGVLSSAVMDGNNKVGIEMRLLPGDEVRSLAAVRTQVQPNAWSKHWIINEATLAWADAYLARLPRPDLLIIDELGPLEFGAGRGLQAAFSLLDNWENGAAVVVIRPELLASAFGRWPEARLIAVSETHADD